MNAPIRKELVIAPGESLARTVEWDANLFPEGTDALSSVTAVVSRERGEGTLTAGGAAAAADKLQASYLATLSDDAVTGSVFVVTLTGTVGNISPKVAERFVVVG